MANDHSSTAVQRMFALVVAVVVVTRLVSVPALIRAPSFFAFLAFLTAWGLCTLHCERHVAHEAHETIEHEGGCPTV
jgi:hypothetical protein